MKYVIDHFLRIKKLVIYDSEIPVNRKEFITNQPFDCRNSVRTSNLVSIEHRLQRPMFFLVKQLKINDELLFDYSNTCELLNFFQNLESLELSALRLQSNGTLRLPALKILTLHFTCVNGNCNKLTLDTIKLQRLRFEFYDQMNLIILYPQQITHLRINDYHHIIRQMTNLEYLFIDRLDVVENDLLRCLPKIKEIHLDHAQQVYANIRKQAYLYAKQSTVYLRGIDFEPTDDAFKQLDHATSRSIIEQFSLKYDRLASTLPFVNYVEYEYLDTYFDTIPSGLLDRMVNLCTLFVDRITNVNKFLTFFNQCSRALRTLSAVELKNTNLDQTFYSSMPNVCTNLYFLTIKDEQSLVDDLNFDFLFKFQYLVRFSTNKHLTIDFVRRMINQLKHLTQIRFRGKDCKIHLFFYIKNSIELYIKNIIKNETSELTFTNFNDLFSYLEPYEMLRIN